MDPPRAVDGLDTPRLLTAGPLAVREDGSEAWLAGADLPLTHAQRLILAALLRRRGRVARRWELYEEAFGRPLPPRSRAVDLHVARIRRALGPIGACLVSIGRVGYRLDLEALARAEAAARRCDPPPETRR